jgi:uncharacterized iron-regulated membrane protein
MSVPVRLKNARKFWFTLHLYAGLVIGFFFVILGLTGSANVFYYELEEFGLPNIEVPAHKPLVTLDTVFHTLHEKYPQKTGKWLLLLPSDDSDYILASYPKPVETANQFFAPFRVLLHPYTGEIVSEYYWGKTLWSLVYEVHADLMTGKLGAKIGKTTFQVISFLGAPLFILLITGLYLGLPRWKNIKQAVTIKRGASIERLYFDIHRVVGIYSALILVVITISGFCFAHADTLKPMIRLFSAVDNKHLKDPKVTSTVIEHTPLSIAEAVQIAQRVFPKATLRGLLTPENKTGVYVVQLRQEKEFNHHYGRSKVWIDQYSGRVLAVQNPREFTTGEQILNSMKPLHSGEAFGLTSKIVWSFIGFMPLVLYVTGIVRWLQKRKAQQNKHVKIKINKVTC